MSKIKVKTKFAPPKLALVSALIKEAVANERKKGFELVLDVPGIDDLRMPIPEPLDTDGPVGQQIEGILGKDISEGLDLSDLAEKRAIVLLVPRRTSGGKFQHSVEAILAPELVRKAAAELNTAAPVTTQTT
jgi:hypothetical protein